MHSCVTSKYVKWCHLIWPTLNVRQLTTETPSQADNDATALHTQGPGITGALSVLVK